MDEKQKKNIEWLNTFDTHEQEYKWLGVLLNNIDNDRAIFGYRAMNGSLYRSNLVIRVMKELAEKCETIGEFTELLNKMQHELIKLSERNDELREKDPRWNR